LRFQGWIIDFRLRELRDPRGRRHLWNRQNGTLDWLYLRQESFDTPDSMGMAHL
jgi:hypothetical protein